MRNPSIIRKFSPLLALLALIVVACSCWDYRHDPPTIFDTPQPAPSCTISFTSPTGSTLPNFGPVEFSWTSVPTADHYVFEIEPPQGTAFPENFLLRATSKTIYIENYSAGGTYRFFVDADDQAGNILCFAEIDFGKAEYTPPGRRPSDSGAQATPPGPP